MLHHISVPAHSDRAQRASHSHVCFTFTCLLHIRMFASYLHVCFTFACLRVGGIRRCVHFLAAQELERACCELFPLHTRSRGAQCRGGEGTVSILRGGFISLTHTRSPSPSIKCLLWRFWSDSKSSNNLQSQSYFLTFLALALMVLSILEGISQTYKQMYL